MLTIPFILIVRCPHCFEEVGQPFSEPVVGWTVHVARCTTRANGIHEHDLTVIDPSGMAVRSFGDST